MSLLLNVSLLLIVISLGAEAAKQLPCNERTADDIDRMVAKLNPLGNSDVDFPETVPDARKYCKQLSKPINTLDDLNKRCMKGMMKEVVGVVLYSVKKKRRVMCRKTTSQELKDVVDSGKCVNKARFDLEKCANRSIDRFVAMNEVQNDMRIPLVCCEIAYAKRCMIDAMAKTPGCQPKHADTLVGQFNGLSGGALKIACNEFGENSERCNKLKSVKLNVKPGNRKSKSLVMPIIRLFESVDQNK